MTFSTYVWGCPVYVLIQSYKMSKRFSSGIVDCMWNDFCVLLIPIIPLWPMPAKIFLVMCRHGIIWSLMTCLKLYLALAMMPCLMIFKTVKYKTWEGVFPSFVCLCRTDRWFCETSFQEKAKNFFAHKKIKLENFLHCSERSDALPCSHQPSIV